MPEELTANVLTIIGYESTPLELEEYANFLRDLVILHDRLWILASPEFKFFPKIYFSSVFYARGRRPIPRQHRLELISAGIGSPFQLNLNINVDKWLEGAANAFVTILRGLATLPANIRRENLLNRLLETRIEKENADAASDKSQASIQETLQAFPALQGDDFEAKVTVLERDIQRISDSHLKIRTVQLTIAKKSEDERR